MMYICAWHAPEFAPDRLISSRITDASVTPSPPPPYSVGNERREPTRLGERPDERLRDSRPPPPRAASSHSRTTAQLAHRLAILGCCLARGLMSVIQVRWNVARATSAHCSERSTRCRAPGARTPSPQRGAATSPTNLSSNVSVVHRILRIAARDSRFAPDARVPSRNVTSTRDGHAAGYAAVRSSRHASRECARAARRSPAPDTAGVEATRRELLELHTAFQQTPPPRNTRC